MGEIRFSIWKHVSIFGTTCVCEFSLSNMNFMISKNNSSTSTENLAPKMRYDVKCKTYTILQRFGMKNNANCFIIMLYLEITGHILE